MKKKLYRGGIYVLGLVILALGITLNTKTGLGVSPITSVAFVAAQIGGWSIGDAVMATYILFLIIQAALKKKQFQLWDLLQLPLSIVFTRFMNLFSWMIALQTFLPWQLLTLALAIVFTGVGAAMSLDMRLIPNPADGLVQTISDCTGKEMGLCKNLVDGANVVVALVISLTLRRTVIGIGVGTVAAIFGIGRVIGWFNRRYLARLKVLAGL